MTETTARKRVLLRFDHGLGDAVQLTVVLAHLAKFRPDWEVSAAGHVGKTSCWKHQVPVFPLGKIPRDQGDPRQRFDEIKDLRWWESGKNYGDAPSTKAVQCLRDEFGIDPDPKLLRYRIEIDAETAAAADEAIAEFGAGVVAIHYQGNTSQHAKDLPHQVAWRVCREVLAHGRIPLILDWDERSPLIDHRDIRCLETRHPYWLGRGTGDGARLAALLARCELVVAIDSGPQKVAGATETPLVAVWRGHHPLRYWDPIDRENVLHLVPENHGDIAPMGNAAAAEYFAQHYRHRVYRDLADALCAAVAERLDPPRGGGSAARTRSRYGPLLVRSDNVTQDACVIRDVYEQDCYRLRKLPPLAPIGEPECIVDVGAHIGCFARAVLDRRPHAVPPRILCVEACPENVAALEANVGGRASIVAAACTYQQDVALWNAVFPNCVSTGGSIVKPKETIEQADPRAGYRKDLRPLETITLEQLLDRFDLPRIDILKLDCEGSEFSILGDCEEATLDSIGVIVGEAHGPQRFAELVAQRFTPRGWQFRWTNNHPDNRNFRLVHPRLAPLFSTH